MRTALVVLLVSTTAAAAPTQRSVAEAQLAFLVQYRDLVRNVTDDDDPKRDEFPEGGKVAPLQFRFDLDTNDTSRAYDRASHKKSEDYYNSYEPDDTDYAVAKDGSAAWLDSTITERYGCFDGIPGEKCAIYRRQHAAMVVSLGKTVQPIASHVAVTTDAARGSSAPSEMPDDALTADAKPVVEVFTKSLATIAKTVSPRKDVVLLGSAFKERYVGADAVRAQLAKWKLVFKVHDHIAAGMVSKTVAWVAANLDAGKTTYRALFVYELTNGAWQLVQASFSLT